MAPTNCAVPSMALRSTSSAGTRRWSNRRVSCRAICARHGLICRFSMTMNGATEKTRATHVIKGQKRAMAWHRGKRTVRVRTKGKCGTAKYVLRTLDADDGRVQEMRGLQLDLKSGESAQWYQSGDYEFKRGAGGLSWQPTDLGIINEYGQPITKYYKP
ncbi:hypothetical protein niasHT_027489 [Heterodera trifolii]|uniref:Uncharacterized protein n=1 Tax=Heterodera trifolii TaxID=157864 RepID=A0ABD2JN01_9BILA